MTRVLLGLGSNLGDRRSYLRRAVDSLTSPDHLTSAASGSVPEGLVVTGVSDVYETGPVGGPPQDRYLNLVVALDDPTTPAPDPYALLEVCRTLEADAERVRTLRWGPRTLDVDLLWIDGVTVDDPELQVPHPRMFERRFVLAPLSELAPDLVTPEVEAASAGGVERLGPLV